VLVFFLFIHRNNNNNNTGSRLSCILLYLSLLLHSPRAFILLLFRRVRVRFRTNTEWKKKYIFIYLYIIYKCIFFYSVHGLPLSTAATLSEMDSAFYLERQYKTIIFFIFKTQNKDNKNKINNKYTPSYPQK